MSDYLKTGIPLDKSATHPASAKLLPSDLRLEYQERRIQIAEYLASLGVNLPAIPNPNQLLPRPWLVRGEPKINPLISGLLQPQSGQFGTRGVFFGECLSPTMLPEHGVIYVYSNSVVPKWVNLKSRMFDRLLKSIATKQNLDIHRIGEAAAAYETVYSKYPVFSPTEGICTIPKPLPVEQARHIIIVGQHHDFPKIESLPDPLKQKMCFFKYQ